jgi:hypothetical protein
LQSHWACYLAGWRKLSCILDRAILCRPANWHHRPHYTQGRTLQVDYNSSCKSRQQRGPHMSSTSGVNYPYGSSTSDQHSPFPFQYHSPDYNNEGPSSSSATFTINPASSRPTSMSLKTRTPRTSLVGSHAERPASAFEMSIYGEPAINEKEALEASSPTAEGNSKPVRVIEVWRELFLTSTGRDKALVRTSTVNSST